MLAIQLKVRREMLKPQLTLFSPHQTVPFWLCHVACPLRPQQTNPLNSLQGISLFLDTSVPGSRLSWAMARLICASVDSHAELALSAQPRDPLDNSPSTLCTQWPTAWRQEKYTSVLVASKWVPCHQEGSQSGGTGLTSILKTAHLWIHKAQTQPTTIREDWDQCLVVELPSLCYEMLIVFLCDLVDNLDCMLRRKHRDQEQIRLMFWNVLTINHPFLKCREVIVWRWVQPFGAHCCLKPTTIGNISASISTEGEVCTEVQQPYFTAILIVNDNGAISHSWQQTAALYI